ncbi:MAG: 16S rRNA (guanine(966)-N(2))-methyltransferase RsmD [Lachnospiraceae bacterium]|nr:16S rRNA (guanine(966)-N(2))-methyltransferase RsmD [Lachnospiraceae bacterium]
MRVIAGSARRLLLKAPQGLETRPTADKYKETLFNVLAPYLYADTEFLDLFAGSGAIGIEALSRGVKHAVFVERSKKAAECIEENLKNTHLRDQAQVMTEDVFSALSRLSGKHVFGIVFLDPPFGQELEKSVLERLSGSDLIDDDSLVVMEVRNDTDLSYLNDPGSFFKIIKQKTYKSNSHVFLEIAHKKGDLS